jgi:hypothetical protein
MVCVVPGIVTTFWKPPQGLVCDPQLSPTPHALRASRPTLSSLLDFAAHANAFAVRTVMASNHELQGKAEGKAVWTVGLDRQAAGLRLAQNASRTALRLHSVATLTVCV